MSSTMNDDLQGKASGRWGWASSPEVLGVFLPIHAPYSMRYGAAEPCGKDYPYSGKPVE